LSRRHPHFLARDLHGTHYGKLCPSETPEGISTSLVKNFAVISEVSVGTDEEPVRAVLESIHLKKDVKGVKGYYAIYLNGNLIGFYKKGEELAEQLRKMRRNSELDYQVNVYLNEKTKELFVNTTKSSNRL